MPVVASKDKKSATLTCEKCGTTVTCPSASPAAPELTACEYAGKEHGWMYSIGFFSMLTGHQVLCPACKEEPSEKVKIQEHM